MSDSTLDLGSLQISLNNVPSEKHLCVLGGNCPSAVWMADFASQFSTVFAVDRGADACWKSKVKPDYLIGDMDSVSEEAYEWSKTIRAKEMRFSTDKCLTDFQIALDKIEALALLKAKKIAVFATGSFGDRWDHVTSNIRSLLYWSKNILPIGMADQNEGLLFLKGKRKKIKVVFEKQPLALSLIPLSEHCYGVQATGVRWPVKNENLTAKKIWTVSNEVLLKRDDRVKETTVTIECQKGHLGVYWKW